MKPDLASAYEGVEADDNFASRQALEDYRCMVLSKTANQARFVRRTFPEARTIVEPCCGNGRLLVALANDLERLDGFDISRSRVSFASRWLEDIGLGHVHVDWADFLAKAEWKRAPADLVACITGAFGYFAPVCDGGAELAARRLAAMTNPEGCLLLELYRHPQVLAHCRITKDRSWNRWSELPEGDPFCFSLSRFVFDETHRVLRHEKAFVGRDGKIDQGRAEAIRIYETSELEALLGQHFGDFQYFGGWDGRPARADDPLLIVVARKSGGA